MRLPPPPRVTVPPFGSHVRRTLQRRRYTKAGAHFFANLCEDGTIYCEDERLAHCPHVMSPSNYALLCIRTVTRGGGGRRISAK